MRCHHPHTHNQQMLGTPSNSLLHLIFPLAPYYETTIALHHPRDPPLIPTLISRRMALYIILRSLLRSLILILNTGSSSSPKLGLGMLNRPVWTTYVHIPIYGSILPKMHHTTRATYHNRSSLHFLYNFLGSACSRFVVALTFGNHSLYFTITTTSNMLFF
jgi:hypothetical protein